MKGYKKNKNRKQPVGLIGICIKNYNTTDPSSYFENFRIQKDCRY